MHRGNTFTPAMHVPRLLSRFAGGLAALACACVLALPLRADALDAALQAKLDAKLPAIRALAAEPALIKAVAAQNAAPAPAVLELTQEKWKTLTVLDPAVRAFTRNEAGALLKARKADWIAEAFVNDAEGRKVAFLAKPTNWTHAGKAKHTEPLAGKTWQGPLEVDESTGLQQIQIAVPVLQDGKPVGSLTVGIAVSKLE